MIKKMNLFLITLWFVLSAFFLAKENGSGPGQESDFKFFTLSVLFLGISIVGFIDSINRVSPPVEKIPSKKQFLFSKVLPFQRHRAVLIGFFISFVSTWLLAYFKIIPQKVTYDIVFSPVIIVGYWWFFKIVKKAYREGGKVRVSRLCATFAFMFILANFVDMLMIKLAAWDFSAKTNLGTVPMTWLLGKDVFGRDIYVPYAEIFGFNGCITWFIHFCQIFINEIIKNPEGIKVLFVGWPKRKSKLKDGLLSGSMENEINQLNQEQSVDLICNEIDEILKGKELSRDLFLEEKLNIFFDGLGTHKLIPEFAHAKRILSSLRKSRLFPQMERVCLSLLREGFGWPLVYRQLAQALIDQNKIESAPFYLNQIDLESLWGSAEWAESKGLLGRTFKQAYIDAGDRSHQGEHLLRSAMEHYREVYYKDMELGWHGINYIACMALGKRHKLNSFIKDPDYKKVATQLYQRVKVKISSEAYPKDLLWDLAICLECCVALEQPDKAKDWANKYVNHSDGHAFEYFSSLRQLIQIWELDRDSKFAESLILIKSALLSKPGGNWNYLPGELEKELKFEIGKDGNYPEGNQRIDWYMQGLKLGSSIYRIETKKGSFVGTGFLGLGQELFPPWGNKLVLITAEHVLGRSAISFLKEGEGMAKIDEKSTVLKLGSILWCSEELDVSIIQINETDLYNYKKINNGINLKNIPIKQILSREPMGNKYVPNKSSLFVMGYPSGNMLGITSNNNLLIGVTMAFIRYRSQTWPGSSGSPVLNEDWEAIGVHTQTTTEQGINRGTHFSAIAAAIQKDFEKDTSPHQKITAAQ